MTSVLVKVGLTYWLIGTVVFACYMERKTPPRPGIDAFVFGASVPAGVLTMIALVTICVAGPLLFIWGG